jgi:hypothetical protein
MLPKAVAHPVQTANKTMRKQGDKSRADVKRLRKRGRKSARGARKALRVG